MWTKEKWSLACGVVLATGLAALPGKAMAQVRQPSDEELRSAYCVEVLRAEITLQHHMISSASEAAGLAEPESRAQWLATSDELLQRLAKLEGALNRLQIYMLPRIPTIDALALASTIRQANDDLQQQSWSSDELSGRARACEDPTWLAQR